MQILYQHNTITKIIKLFYVSNVSNYFIGLSVITVYTYCVRLTKSIEQYDRH